MTEKAKPVPEGVQAVMPMLVCANPDEAIDFCRAVFHAEERVRRAADDGTVLHCALTISGAMFMLQRATGEVASRPPSKDGSSPVVIYVYLPDVDRAVERAEAAGATILTALKTQFWGDRTARIMDPAGHVWVVASRVQETTEKERVERWSSIRSGGG